MIDVLQPYLNNPEAIAPFIVIIGIFIFMLFNNFR